MQPKTGSSDVQDHTLVFRNNLVFRPPWVRDLWWHNGRNQVPPNRANPTCPRQSLNLHRPCSLCTNLPSYLGHRRRKTLVIEVRAARCPTMGPFGSSSSKASIPSKPQSKLITMRPRLGVFRGTSPHGSPPGKIWKIKQHTHTHTHTLTNTQNSCIPAIRGTSDPWGH